MGIITLGIGGKQPRITYLVTSGLAVTGIAVVSATVTGPAATATIAGPVDSVAVEG